MCKCRSFRMPVLDVPNVDVLQEQARICQIASNILSLALWQCPQTLLWDGHAQ